MPRRGKRRRLTKNVYADLSGISGFVNVRGHREEMRFLPGTPLREIQRDMDGRAKQIDLELGEAPLRGSVADVFGRVIQDLPETPADAERAQRLQTWVDACGAEPFVRLKRSRLFEVIAAWKRAGKSANTIAKRISSFRQVWDAMAPDDAAPHAIERVKRPRPPKAAQVRARPLELIEMVLANVARSNLPRDDESKAYARLRTMAWTGQPPALLQKLKPEHVRWTTTPAEMYVQPRRKGEGVDAAWIPLLPQAVGALREFFRVDAGGPWHRGVIRIAWRRAIKRTQEQLREAGRDDDAAMLDHFRPYDLRHSLLTAMGTATDDVYAVSEYARHSDIRTTLIYMKGSSSPRMKAGLQKFAATLPGSPQRRAAIGGRKVQRKRKKRKNPRNAASGRSRGQ